MKLAVNIIFPIILFAKITFSQTILENKFTFDTIENIAVSKRLIGAWNLVKTIRYENLDTITKEPSV